MTRRILLFTLLALCASAASAGRSDTVRKQVEASMQITGELVVAPDGAVESYKLDRADALPPEIRELFAERIPTWQLDARKADGSPLQSPSAVKMSVQLVGRAIDDDQFRVTIGGVALWDPKAPVDIKVKGEFTPPKYPVLAWRSEMTGVVYVVLRLNPDGTVAETHVERVDMTVLTNERTLHKFGKMLADATVDAAKQWTSSISPERLARPEPVDLRMPVAFALAGSNQAKYGKWRAYVPGAYAPIPWQKRIADDIDGGIGAMVPNQVYPLDASIKLKGSPAGT